MERKEIDSLTKINVSGRCGKGSVAWTVNMHKVTTEHFTKPGYTCKVYLKWHLGASFLGGVNQLACEVRVAVGDSGLCCCVCVTSFES